VSVAPPSDLGASSALPGLRARHLIAPLLVGAALFSLDVLRASPREHLGTVVLLSFTSALIKFLLWGAAGVLIWRLCRRVPLARAATHLAAALGLSALVTLLSAGLQSGLRSSLLAVLPAGAPGRLLDSWTGHRTELGASLVLGYPWDLLTYFAIFALVAFWQWALRARERERRALALAREVSRARLHALETQLHPHFLHNALNTISSLVERDPAAARAVTRGLRGLLRRLLAAETAPVQPLRDEIDFLRDYVSVQEARFGGGLRFELEVEPECAAALVPSLLLQPLVENAVRHVAAHRRGPTRIRVSARREREDLILEVHDDGPGATDGGAHAGSGIGLANTRQRLREIYGERQQFRFEPTAPPLGGALVRMVLPLQHAPPVLPPAAEIGVAPASPLPSPAGRLWLLGLLLFAGAMFVLNLIWSSARYLVYARPAGQSFTDVIAAGSRGAAALVLLFPLVYWANLHLVPTVRRLPPRVALHGLLALGLSIAKSTLVRGSLLLSGVAVVPSVAGLVLMRIYADLLHYTLMAGLCYALARYRDHREHMLREARLEVELAGARLFALQLRLEPDLLFSTLDRLELLIDQAPEEADRLVADLGDRLRRVLRASHRPAAVTASADVGAATEANAR
jgi:two-component system, LytTR family, sensor kinase